MNLRQHPVLPSKPRPICLVGAGGIVRNAHLPAYDMCGWQVLSVFDTNRQTAESLANDFKIPSVAPTLQALVESAPEQAVFDIAVPASQVLETVQALPDSAAVLIQKPLGENLEQARQIVALCEQKGLKAAVNFQLRTAPYSLAASQLVHSGALGDILEVDVKVNVHTPWELWDFLATAPRMEIVYHSIHYLDLVRSLLGEPRSVKATTTKHPASARLHSSRSAVLMSYGEYRRAQIVTYHGHKYGPRHQQSQVMVEGTQGAVAFQMGLNMDYPTGGPDWLEYNLGDGWIPVELEGTWFPHAFRGPMAALMAWANGGPPAPTNVHDAIKTMALVEAAYIDSENPGTDPKRV